MCFESAILLFSGLVVWFSPRLVCSMCRRFVAAGSIVPSPRTFVRPPRPTVSANAHSLHTVSRTRGVSRGSCRRRGAPRVSVVQVRGTLDSTEDLVLRTKPTLLSGPRATHSQGSPCATWHPVWIVAVFAHHPVVVRLRYSLGLLQDIDSDARFADCSPVVPRGRDGRGAHLATRPVDSSDASPLSVWISNRAPPSWPSVRWTSHPCASATRSTMERPRPVPASSVE